MDEFLFEDKTEDLVELIGFSPIKKCYIVINAELALTSKRFFPHSGRNSSEVREELFLKEFKKGLKKCL